MLTATNDRRAYIRRRSVDVAVHDGAIAHATLHKYSSQVAYARLAVAPSVALPPVGQENSSFPPFIVARLQMGMSDNDEIQSRLNRMDEAFCARMRAAIEAGLETAPIGIVTTPGTQNPKLAGRYGARQERGTAIDG